MVRKLEEEIQQGKPLESLEQAAFLNLLRTTWLLSHDLATLLRPAGLSTTNYNVLRILRGAGERGATCREIAERMVTRVPDVTRLLARLEARRLIIRERGAGDRRVVRSRITPKGQALLSELDGAVSARHIRQLGHLGPARLQALITILEAARELAGAGPPPVRACPDAREVGHSGPVNEEGTVEEGKDR